MPMVLIVLETKGRLCSIEFEAEDEYEAEDEFNPQFEIANSVQLLINIV